MDKEKIRAELDAFIESGKAKVEVNSGNFVTTHIDMLKIAEHFYKQAETDLIEKAVKWLDDHIYDYECEPMGEYPRLAMLDDFEKAMSEF